MWSRCTRELLLLPYGANGLFASLPQQDGVSGAGQQRRNLRRFVHAPGSGRVLGVGVRQSPTRTGTSSEDFQLSGRSRHRTACSHPPCCVSVPQGSPFALTVSRKWRHHSGTFHCCCFCSSGGSKEARCGCPGTMPGTPVGRTVHAHQTSADLSGSVFQGASKVAATGIKDTPGSCTGPAAAAR